MRRRAIEFDGLFSQNQNYGFASVGVRSPTLDSELSLCNIRLCSCNICSMPSSFVSTTWIAFALLVVARIALSVSCFTRP